MLSVAIFSACGGNTTSTKSTASTQPTTHVDEVALRDSIRRDSIQRDSIRHLCDSLERAYNPWRYMNSIKGHDERDTIEGNFTGRGIDKLYVELDTTFDIGDYMTQQYFIRSTNKRLPKIRILAQGYPLLVNEGDLDRNGTCEFGFLQPWGMSRYRLYFILTFWKGSWRYLFTDDCLVTPDAGFRGSGVEIAEPGPRKGKVLVHYGYEGYDEKTQEHYLEIRDKIVTPTYKKINLSQPLSYF